MQADSLKKLEDILFALASLGGGIRCVEGPFPPGPSLDWVPEGANVPRHFVMWFPDATEDDGECWARFTSLDSAVKKCFGYFEAKIQERVDIPPPRLSSAELAEK